MMFGNWTCSLNLSTNVSYPFSDGYISPFFFTMPLFCGILCMAVLYGLIFYMYYVGDKNEMDREVKE